MSFFKKSSLSPQQRRTPPRVATIPEAESLKGSALVGLSHQESVDLFPVTSIYTGDSESAASGSASASMIGGSSATSSVGGHGGHGPGGLSGSMVSHAPSSSSSPTSMGSSLKMARQWDLKMGPFKKTMVGGHLVPTPLSPVQFLRWGKRRVTIELYGKKSDDAPTSSTTTPPLVSDSLTATSSMSGDAATTDSDKWPLEDSDVIYLRMYKQASPRRLRKGAGNGTSAAASGSDDDDHSEVDDDASLIGGMAASFMSSPFQNHSMGKEWREHRSYKLEDVVLLKAASGGRVVEVKVGAGAETVVRDFKFDSEPDARAFERIFNKLREREKARAERQIARYRLAKKGDKPPHAGSKSGTEPSASVVGADADATIDESTAVSDEDDTINLLVEIVSATDLPVADVFSTDAYVVVRMGGKEVHKTKVISKSLNPIWTLRTGSLFLLSMSPEEFFACSGGMTFAIKDYDAVGSNEVLGYVYVSLEELLKSKGEREPYDIIPEKNFRKDGDKKQGKLFLRIKEASNDDVEFMCAYKMDPKKVGAYAEETFLPIRAPVSKFLKRQTKRGEGGEIVHRVKPFPDPKRPEDTTWLTKETIDSECMKPSTHWVEAGSGTVGKLFVEILRCEGLPNMDALTANPRDQTDAVACLVFEDAIVNTDVIGDCLSPRWMPWCRRAFVFDIAHPSSTLLIGLFDHDPEKSPLQLLSRAAGDLHDAIGRIKIRISNFRQNTVYTTAYPIFFGELPEQRKKQNGKIWIRFRTEWCSPRKALISAAMPPPVTTVSVHRRIDFQVAHYTVEGPYDEEAFDMGTFARYIEELQSYEIILNYLKLAGYGVWLWRGHFPVTICNKNYLLPLHSMVAFTWGMIVAWDFNTIPSFLMFALGWAFLALNEFVRSTPSPWHKCPPFSAALYALLFDEIPFPVLEHGSKFKIDPNQDLEAFDDWKKEVEEREHRWKRDKELELEHEQELLKEFGEEHEEDDVSSSGKGGLLQNLNVNPLKPVLYPIQLQLHQVVVYLRIAKSIVLWDETYFAFWITFGCFTASLVLFWIPFGFLLRWSLRVIVFLVLGPWMALVDRWYFRENPNLTAEEKDAIVRQRMRSRYETLMLAASNFQIRKERATKLRSMTKYMFGKFTLRVPRFCEDSFRDTPLPESYAVPFDKANAPTIEIAERKYGQRLSGDMIPKREVQVAASCKRQPRPSRNRILPFAGATDAVAEKVSERVPLLGRVLGRQNRKGYASVAAAGSDTTES